MYNVKLLPSAKQDIDRIFFYIADDLAAPLSALNTVSKIYQKISILEIFPEGSPPAFKKPYRKIHSGKYTIFYVIDKQKKEVVVTAVVYSRRNLNKII